MPSAMRTADRRAPLARVRTLAAAVTIGLVAAACGGSPPSAPPASAAPVVTPGPTPVAHLSEPAKADSIYLALLAAGLRIVPNNASTGGPGNEPVKRINATYAGWPLAISQFSSSASLRTTTDWKAGARPGQGESSIAFMGLNILVEYGPTSGTTPKTPDDRQLAAAEALHQALDALVSPLSARTIVAIPGVPESTAAPTASPSPKAKPTARPSAKPTARPTAKATKKP
jgi:hypothetical protein